MSNKRRRSRSDSRERKRPRDYSEERERSLPRGIDKISEADYFLKSTEFRAWLKDTKDKYFDELTGDKARHYFRKFVKRWNSGRLSDDLYAGLSPMQPSSSQTAFKWAFATKGDSKIDSQAIRAAREEVESATYKSQSSSSSGPSRSTGGRILGPSLPTPADLQLAREEEEEARRAGRHADRKRENARHKERVEEQVGPKEAGREGALEKKRVQREGNKAHQNAKDEAGLEVSEDILMGEGNSFQQMVARRDAARRRADEKKQVQLSSTQERAIALREKEKATMDMFKAMAKERFG
ncbi:hypothetical protein SISSUDRAFT_977870 [Sistotremastrum suecicum HHB10207 ss-3]|uniref:Splicing arginine serine-rich 12 n=1 Tax=Sistotremastrum suecicum HHB10207 ss-3 TaxID=1314776 RepID=A0A166IKR0_9AGAM|nr:hypothetical protein SISSUDRAFT_977870 [Sistotremastrum suecicum HHB10207 ss-3]